MAKSLSILFVTSEIYPYSKAGGLGDISYSLPLALRLTGHDVRVMMPKYGSTSERRNRIHEINRLRDIPITVGDETFTATVKSSSINNPRSKVQAYITTNQKFFDLKKGIYHDPKSWIEYPDNAERFIFFNKSVIDTCLLLGWFPDVIHCNDWQCGLIPGYVKVLHPHKFKKTKIVYTARNFQSQGSFPNLDFKTTGLPKEAKNAYLHKNVFNFLKGGLYYSDYITTVSPKYAKDALSDSSFSNGLHSVLKSLNNRFQGIICGIDDYYWSPEKDPELKYKLKYNLTDFKYNNKVQLLKQFSLIFNTDIPLIGIIANLKDDSGISLFIESADKILKENVQVVLLGQGDAEIKKQIQNIAKKYKNKFSYKFEFNDSIAHLIEAGADFYLSPKEIEPCGLNIMYSLRYATIPIVRYYSGTQDIVTEYDPKTKKGNSIVFHKYNSADFVKAVLRALNYFKDKETVELLIKDGMNLDFSWDKSAEIYSEIYRNLMKD